MKLMFNKCYEIEYLDLSNYDLANVKNMSYMLTEYNSLKYLNLLNFTINCNTECMLEFQQKKKCTIKSNNKDLLMLYVKNYG